MPEVAEVKSTITPLSMPQPRKFVFTRELALAGLTMFVVILYSVLYPKTFCSVENFTTILRNLAFEGILALGMMLLMVAGVFDLSVGAMASMAGVITGALMKKAGLPVPASILLGLSVAAFGGFLNGWVVAKLRVNALITTLGAMGVFQGVALIIAGPGISFLPDTFAQFGRFEFPKLSGELQHLRLQGPVWLLLALALVGHYCLKHTRFFRQYYYIGSNPKAAHLSGIKVERMQMLAFTVMGLLAGIAGITYASRIATASATVGVGSELQAITAVILGGASLAGGKGTIWGAMLGVFFMALMKNVLIISKVSSEWQGIILGAVLVLAVALDSVTNRKRG